MSSNKRLHDEIQDKKIKIDIQIDSFDGKLDLNNFEKYIIKVRSFQDEVKELVKKRRLEKLLESEPKCAEMKKRIKEVKHNVSYNLFHLQKINRILKDIEGELKTNLEDFCDHDIYSECEYHNDRYYYCRKCTYER
jgi:hypothetical protein